MSQAKDVVRRVLGRPTQGSFIANVKQQYETLADGLDSYIFCMSDSEEKSEPKPQDRLSQWRAYGQDGRGVCLSFDAPELANIVNYTPGLRINPVIYEPWTQLQFMGGILMAGERLNQQGDPSAVAATVGALVSATPLMKARGFSEELEWRLIFMPPSAVQARLEFHPRRDVLAPFLRLQYIWNSLRPRLAGTPSLKPDPPLKAPFPTGSPLLPVIGIMVGPSIHKALNERSMTKLLAQSLWPSLQAATSDIPYRSID